MSDGKLMVLYKILNPAERQKFGWYVRSPFFNKQKKLVVLHDFIAQHYAEQPDLVPDKQKVYKHIFGSGAAFDDNKIRFLMSQLTRLLENFLRYILSEKQTLQSKSDFLKVLGEYSLEKYFWQTFKDLKQQLETADCLDTAHYYCAFATYEQAYQFSLQSKSNPIETSLQEAVDNLDAFYAINKLRYSCAMLTRQNILAAEYRAFMIEPLIENIPTNPIAEKPAVQAYYNLLCLLYKKDDKYFFTLRQLLSERLPLNKLDLGALYTGLSNFCVQQIKVGQLQYYTHLFDIYKEMVATEIIISGDYISPNHYRNIVALGLRIGEIDWTKRFIHSHKKYLHPNYSDSLFNYNMALLYFNQKNYDKARIHLIVVTFKDVFSHITCKKLLLQTYFELMETEALFSLVANFRDLLRRSEKISLHNRNAYRNFVNSTIKIYRIKQSPIQSREHKRLALLKVKREIEQLTPLIDKEWLLEKLSEMAAKYKIIEWN